MDWYFVSIAILIVFIIIVIEKSLHELGHKLKYKKYGLPTSININWRLLGMFYCELNKKYYNDFNKISLHAKKEILLIGIKIDLVFAITYATLLLIVPPITFPIIFSSILALFIVSILSVFVNSFVPNISDFSKYKSFRNGRKL